MIFIDIYRYIYIEKERGGEGGAAGGGGGRRRRRQQQQRRRRRQQQQQEHTVQEESRRAAATTTYQLYILLCMSRRVAIVLRSWSSVMLEAVGGLVGRGSPILWQRDLCRKAFRAQGLSLLREGARRVQAKCAGAMCIRQCCMNSSLLADIVPPE